MTSVRVVVGGEVQGVGYRLTAQLEARERGVAGWVRNRRDGAVEAQLEGDAAAVDGMVEWMRQGPPGSRVDSVEVTDAAASGLDRFEVRGTA